MSYIKSECPEQHVHLHSLISDVSCCQYISELIFCNRILKALRNCRCTRHLGFWGPQNLEGSFSSKHTTSKQRRLDITATSWHRGDVQTTMLRHYVFILGSHDTSFDNDSFCSSSSQYMYVSASQVSENWTIIKIKLNRKDLKSLHHAESDTKTIKKTYGKKQKKKKKTNKQKTAISIDSTKKRT